MNQPTFSLSVSLLAGALALVAGCPALAQQSKPAAEASVTVFPVLLADSPSRDVASVLGVLLERGGLPQVELAAGAFAPDRKQGFAEQASAFGVFARAQGLKTDYGLFADFLGSPKTGVLEVRGVLVDKQGALVWSERQKA